MADNWTIGTILQWTKQYFRDKGVENPRLDAEVLLSFMLGKDRMYLYVHFDQPLEAPELAAFRELVRRRAGRIPVAYITGSKEFMGLLFQVSEAVLIPRPDTEILVETALDLLAPESCAKILDVGTGSGAVLIGTLSRRPGCRGIGVDISTAALVVASENARRLLPKNQAAFQQADLFPLPGTLFDAILSNPPYITTAEMTELEPEVKKEPELALCGGDDGLNFYRRLIERGKEHLAADGFMALEVGANQAQLVAGLASAGGWRTEKIVNDYAGIERVVVLRPGKQGETAA